MSHDDTNPAGPLGAPETAPMSVGNQLVPIAGSNGFQQQISFDHSQSLDLSITNVNGEIRVKASDEQTIWLVVRSNKGRHEDEINLTVSVEGNKISIHPDWQLSSSLAGLARKIKDQLKNGLEPGDWNISKLRFGDDFDYDIRVEVPRHLAEGSRIALRSTSGAVHAEGLHTNVSIATASGAITASDLRGQVSMHSASGKVQATQVSESLEINTASGSITVTGGEAWTALRSVSGSIKVEDFVMKNAKVASVSGSVRANFVANNTAPYSFDTVSGSIELNTTFPATDEGASLTFRSVSGSANVRGEWVSAGKRNWKIGEGTGAAFRMNTVSGSLQMNGKRDPSVSAKNEPLPDNSHAGDENDEHRHTHEEHRHHHDEMRHQREELRHQREELRRQREQHRGPQFDIDINREEINKAVNWAREAARRFTQPIEPFEQTPPPPAPSAPATPATPATPSTPATPASPVTPPAAPPTQGAEAFTQAPAAETSHTEPATQAQPGNDAANRPEDEEALNVLEALERGDIDVEEALARIERAEHPSA